MFEVHSWVDSSTGATKLLIGEKTEGGAVIVYNLHTGMAQRVERGEQVPPAYHITLPWTQGPEIEKALAEWLARKGVRNDNDSLLEGKLEATRYHLEDLRQLLKLAKPEGRKNDCHAARAAR